MNKRTALFVLLNVVLIVSVSGCTGSSDTKTGNKQLSANIEVNSLSPISLVLHNQNNFDWHNAKAIVNGVWIAEIGDLEIGQLKVLSFGNFQDKDGQTMPLVTNLETIEIISNEGRATYKLTYNS